MIDSLRLEPDGILGGLDGVRHVVVVVVVAHEIVVAGQGCKVEAQVARTRKSRGGMTAAADLGALKWTLDQQQPYESRGPRDLPLGQRKPASTRVEQPLACISKRCLPGLKKSGELLKAI
jgi:hypothetical protein